MYSKFEEEINKVLENTLSKIGQDKKREAENQKKVAMYQQMIDVFKNYVKTEAETNPDFNNALSFEWKSATRMLKFIADKAREREVNGMSFVPDSEVYDWINDYYALDDKAKVEQELKEEAERKAKEEARKKKEAEQKVIANQKAREELEATPEWETLSDDEKKKKLASKEREILTKIQAAERRKETTAKKKAEEEKKKDSSAKEKSKAPISSSDEDDELPDFDKAENSDDELPNFSEATDSDDELPNFDEESDNEDDELPDFDSFLKEEEVNNETEALGFMDADDVPFNDCVPNKEPVTITPAPVTLKDLDEQISIFDIFSL